MSHFVVNHLRGQPVMARDGSVGTIEDAYFDDQDWTVRFVVVDTGEWLPGRKVLLPPDALHVDEDGVTAAGLSREDVRTAPSQDQADTVSSLCDEALATRYGASSYWAATGVVGMGAMPVLPAEAMLMQQGQAASEGNSSDLQERARHTHLRSSREVIGYHIKATDGDIGHVEDLVLDDWKVSDIVVDTRNWLPGKKVLVSPSAVEDISWGAGSVALRMDKDAVRHSPQA